MYYSAHFCSNCKIEIPEVHRIRSYGVCVHCGHVTPGTICDTIKVSYKEDVRIKRSKFLFMNISNTNTYRLFNRQDVDNHKLVISGINDEII